MPGAGVPRFQLIVPRGEPLGAPSHCAVRPLAFWHQVFCLGDPAYSPLPCLGPLLLGDLPLEIGERPWESFVSSWPPCRFFGPLIRLFVASDAFVGRAPANLYRVIWPSPSQCRDVLPCLAYCCPGPGSSDVIRLMAACASEKMVTSSGVVFLCAPS